MLRTAAEVPVRMWEKHGLQVFEEERKEAGISAWIRHQTGVFEQRLK
jgi:hypothetical protein